MSSSESLDFESLDSSQESNSMSAPEEGTLELRQATRAAAAKVHEELTSILANLKYARRRYSNHFGPPGQAFRCFLTSSTTWTGTIPPTSAWPPPWQISARRT